MDVSAELVGAIGAVIITPLGTAVGLLLRQRSEERREHAKTKADLERLAIETKARENTEAVAERDRIRAACEAEKEVLRKAHAAEMAARIADAQAYAASMIKVHEVVIVTANESRASDARTVAELEENTRVTRELGDRLVKAGILPRGGSKP